MDVVRAPQKGNGRRYVVIGAVLLVIVPITVALTKMGPADQTVERLSIVIDTVKKGDMVREARGPGTLVPEHIRWISAVTSARVERIVAQPGQQVEPNTVLLEMSNPDVQIEALRAEQALSEAQARLVELKVQLESARLSQEGSVASMKTTNAIAMQEGVAADTLLARRLISPFEATAKRASAEEAKTRLSVEQRRLALLSSSVDSQLAVQRRQIDRLRAIAEFERGRVLSLVVRAGERGVLQELSLQPGQWVNGGTPMAKVVQPGALKAVLRIPETQAKDVTVGLPVMIDTRNGMVAGHVSRSDPGSQGGSVTIDVAFDAPLPAGARPDLSVDGVVQVERLKNVLYTGRPSIGAEHATIQLYRVDPNGSGATRVPVRLGRVSVNAVEILSGLQAGDKVVLSDLSLPDNTSRIRIH